MPRRIALVSGLVTLATIVLAAIAVIWVMMPGPRQSGQSGQSGQSAAPVSAVDAPVRALPSHPAEHQRASHSLYDITEAQLLEIQGERGPAKALAELERRIRELPQLAGMCHALTHTLGHAAFDAAGGDVTKALLQGDEVCGNGYTHGVIETALADSTDPARDMLRICAPEQSGSCFHGVGHGLMFATGMSVEASLDLCEGAPTSVLAGRCGEGVFMQLFSADLAAGHGAKSNAEFRLPTSGEIAGLCGAVRRQFAANCWFYAPTVYLTEHEGDFTGALQWCRVNGSGIDMCAKGVGSRAIKFHPDDVRIADGTCWAAGSLRDHCYRGMGSYWSVHWKGERDAINVCTKVEQGHRRACGDAFAD